MLGSEKMALLALTLLMLTAAAHSSEIQAQEPFFNGMQYLESLFTKLNITMPSARPKPPGFEITPANSALEDNFRDGTVYSSIYQDRMSFLSFSSFNGFLNFYTLPRFFEMFTFDAWKTQITNNQLGYMYYTEDGSKSVKYFLTKMTWADASTACKNDLGTLYTLDHSAGLDKALAALHPTELPWFENRKSLGEGGTDLRCGYFKDDFNGFGMLWGSCLDLRPYICEYQGDVHPADNGLQISDVLPTANERYTQTPEGDTSSFTYSAIKNIESTGYAIGTEQTVYNQLEYLTFLETPASSVKYYPIKTTWLGAKAACEAEGAQLYRFDHSVDLDSTMGLFYYFERPWVDLKKPGTEDPSVGAAKCGLLHGDVFLKSSVHYADCTSLNYYACEKVTIVETTTTDAPTTLDPTTLDPTTLDPTTLDPTTLDPTTLDPTTLDPTTLETTTDAPTTLDPTTLETTTDAPTTLDPTTLETTTEDPTTLEPTTIEVTTTTRRPRPTRPPRPTGAHHPTRPPRPTGAHHPTRPPRPTGAHHPTRPPPRPTRPNRPNRPAQQQVFLGQLASGQRYNVTVNVFVNSLRSLADAINSDNSIRSELRDLPELLLTKLISLGEKRVLFEERWPTMSTENQLTFVTNIERYTEELKKLVNERSLLTKYFSYNKGERQLITVKLDEMVEFMTPYF